MEDLQKQWKVAKIKGNVIEFLIPILDKVNNPYDKNFNEINKLSILKILNDYVSNLKKKSNEESNEKESKLLHKILHFVTPYDHLNILKKISDHISFSWVTKAELVKSKHEYIVQYVLSSIDPKDWYFFRMIREMIKNTMNKSYELLVFNTLKQYITFEYMSNSYDLRFVLGDIYDKRFVLNIIIKAIKVQSPIFELLFNDNTEYCKDFKHELIIYSIIFSNHISLKMLLDKFNVKTLDSIINKNIHCKLTKEIVDILIIFFPGQDTYGQLFAFNIDVYIHVIDTSNRFKHYSLEDKGKYYYEKQYKITKYYEDTSVEIDQIYGNIIYILTQSNNMNLNDKTLLKLFACLISKKDFTKFKQFFDMQKPTTKCVKKLLTQLLAAPRECIFLNYNTSCLDCDDYDYDGFYSRDNYDNCHKNHMKWNKDKSFEFFCDALSLLVTTEGDNLQDIIQINFPDIINFYINNNERILKLVSVVNIDEKLLLNTYRYLSRLARHYPYNVKELTMEEIALYTRPYNNGRVFNVILVHDLMLSKIKLDNYLIFNDNLTCKSFSERIYCIVNEMNSKYYDKLEEFYSNDNEIIEKMLKISYIKIVLSVRMPDDIINTIIKIVQILLN
jgi:hypothetical protein